MIWPERMLKLDFRTLKDWNHRKNLWQFLSFTRVWLYFSFFSGSFFSYSCIQTFSCWLPIFNHFYFCFCPFNLLFPPLFWTAADKFTLPPSPPLLYSDSDHYELFHPHGPHLWFISCDLLWLPLFQLLPRKGPFNCSLIISKRRWLLVTLTPPTIMKLCGYFL